MSANPPRERLLTLGYPENYHSDHPLIDDLSCGLPSVLDMLKTHVPKSFETVLDHIRELVRIRTLRINTYRAYSRFF